MTLNLGRGMDMGMNLICNNKRHDIVFFVRAFSEHKGKWSLEGQGGEKNHSSVCSIKTGKYCNLALKTFSIIKISCHFMHRSNEKKHNFSF